MDTRKKWNSFSFSSTWASINYHVFRVEAPHCNTNIKNVFHAFIAIQIWGMCHAFIVELPHCYTNMRNVPYVYCGITSLLYKYEECDMRSLWNYLSAIQIWGMWHTFIMELPHCYTTMRNVAYVHCGITKLQWQCEEGRHYYSNVLNGNMEFYYYLDVLNGNIDRISMQSILTRLNSPKHLMEIALLGWYNEWKH